jgi:cysteinyl-tRNA synthetase
MAGEPNPPLGPKAAGRMISAAKFLGLLNEDVSEWVQTEKIERAIFSRAALIKAKNWAEADKIRDELLEQGIQLKDGKDAETGERVTTWEVKR